MDASFIKDLLIKHAKTQEVPSTQLISEWSFSLMEVLFPEVSEKRLNSEWEIQNIFGKLELELKTLLYNTRSCDHTRYDEIAEHFFSKLPAIYKDLLLDIEAIVAGDPAAWSALK